MLVRLDAMGIAQKTKFSINDFFSKYEQIHSFLKSLIFFAVGLNVSWWYQEATTGGVL